MEWLRPITEKLNANILIAAVALTSLGWWYFSKYDLLLAIGCCCGLYLIILFLYNLIQSYKAKKDADKRKMDALEKIAEEDRQKNLRIDVWFASLNEQYKDNLLKMMTWNSLPNAINVRIYSPDKERLFFYQEEFTIDMGGYEDPIRLVYPIENYSSNSYCAYFIHPHLIKLLIDYSANNKRTLKP